MSDCCLAQPRAKRTVPTRVAPVALRVPVAPRVARAARVVRAVRLEPVVVREATVVRLFSLPVPRPWEPLAARPSPHSILRVPESEQWSRLSYEQAVRSATVSHLLPALQLLT